MAVSWTGFASEKPATTAIPRKILRAVGENELEFDKSLKLQITTGTSMCAVFALANVLNIAAPSAADFFVRGSCDGPFTYETILKACPQLRMATAGPDWQTTPGAYIVHEPPRTCDRDAEPVGHASGVVIQFDGSAVLFDEVLAAPVRFQTRDGLCAVLNGIEELTVITVELDEPGSLTSQPRRRLPAKRSCPDGAARPTFYSLCAGGKRTTCRVEAQAQSPADLSGKSKHFECPLIKCRRPRCGGLLITRNSTRTASCGQLYGSDCCVDCELAAKQCPNCGSYYRHNFMRNSDGSKTNVLTHKEMLDAGVLFVSPAVGFTVAYLRRVMHDILVGKKAPGQEASILMEMKGTISPTVLSCVTVVFATIFCTPWRHLLSQNSGLAR